MGNFPGRAGASLPLAFAIGGLAAFATAGCDALVESLAHREPRTADVLVRLEMPGGFRSVATIPGEAARVQIVVKDDLGFVAGGVKLRDIAPNTDMAIPGLPPGRNLRFLATVTNTAGGEVAVGKKHETLPGGQISRVVIPIYMNTPDLTGGELTSITSESTNSWLSTRMRLENNRLFALVPSVSAVDSLGNPVACSPTHSFVGGLEGAEVMGSDVVSGGTPVVRGTGALFNAQVRFTENCGPGASVITRRLTIQRVASASVAVN